ncbi:MAG: amidohydrolase [Clostridia bacterium]|nr:amidohydrolase [Clostridia bacterium]
MRKIIDFHAHIFNPKIAHLAIENLEQHYGMKWECKGTFTDMKAQMDQSGFYKAVIFSTPTKPTQVVINNDFLFDLKDDRFIIFGSVHPDYEDVAYEIQRVKNHGLKGFKFHPDFQRFNIDDDKALFMYEKIGEDYPIVLHVGDKNLDYSNPVRLSRVLEIFPNHKFVAAHMGGYSMWDNEVRCLVGKNVWFDTSSTMWEVTPEKMVQMIRAHGADKVLFGTDYPAVSLAAEAEKIEALNLSEEEKEKIFYKNAATLLELE